MGFFSSFINQFSAVQSSRIKFHEADNSYLRKTRSKLCLYLCCVEWIEGNRLDKVPLHALCVIIPFLLPQCSDSLINYSYSDSGILITRLDIKSKQTKCILIEITKNKKIFAFLLLLYSLQKSPILFQHHILVFRIKHINYEFSFCLFVCSFVPLLCLRLRA